MAISVTWRGGFASAEVNVLHAEAFATQVFEGAEWDWSARTAECSLGWVTARDGASLVGFVNVAWDGLVYAWLQDTMVAGSHRRRGVGRAVVAAAREGAQGAGCEWLHVDFDEELRPFYVDACGFVPTAGGLIRLP